MDFAFFQDKQENPSAEAEKTGRDTPTTSFFESKQLPPSSGEGIAAEAKRRFTLLRSTSPLTTTMASPKGINKRKATTLFTPQGGRTAHMLGLVTRQAMKEKELQSPNVEGDKEKEACVAATRKDMASVMSKEPEKYSSPSSSSGRQDKIFSMMSTSDSKLKTFLSKFKNDGDGASPGKDKGSADSYLLNRVDSMDHGSGSDMSPLRETLPLFEWKKENPASSNASPSSSILKTSRTSTAMESEPSDSSASRVSFAISFVFTIFLLMPLFAIFRGSA